MGTKIETTLYEEIEPEVEEDVDSTDSKDPLVLCQKTSSRKEVDCEIR